MCWVRGSWAAASPRSAATGGFDVVCYDIAPEALDAGREHATTGRYGLDSGVERGS